MSNESNFYSFSEYNFTLLQQIHRDYIIPETEAYIEFLYSNEGEALLTDILEFYQESQIILGKKKKEEGLGLYLWNYDFAIAWKGYPETEPFRLFGTRFHGIEDFETSPADWPDAYVKDTVLAFIGIDNKQTIRQKAKHVYYYLRANLPEHIFEGDNNIE